MQTVNFCFHPESNKDLGESSCKLRDFSLHSTEYLGKAGLHVPKQDSKSTSGPIIRLCKKSFLLAITYEPHVVSFRFLTLDCFFRWLFLSRVRIREHSEHKYLGPRIASKDLPGGIKQEKVSVRWDGRTNGVVGLRSFSIERDKRVSLISNAGHLGLVRKWKFFTKPCFLAGRNSFSYYTPCPFPSGWKEYEIMDWKTWCSRLVYTVSWLIPIGRFPLKLCERLSILDSRASLL